MKKLYEKSELGFALVWIGIYCVGMSAFSAPGESMVRIAILCLLTVAYAVVLLKTLPKETGENVA